MALGACGSDGGPGQSTKGVSLAPSEVFLWGDQPIEFAPPAAGWRREKQLSGGLRGLWFIREGSRGERIEVAEHHALGERDRCVELRDLSASIQTVSRRSFVNALQRARPYALPAINRLEERLADQANQSLDRALDAFRQDDREEARYQLDWAVEELGQVRYSLDDVMELVMGSARRNQSLGRFEIGEPRRGEVGGVPSVRVHYELEVDGEKLVGREVHLLHNNRLFVASYQGFKGSLPVFEAVVETVRFPAGPCSH